MQRLGYGSAIVLTVALVCMHIYTVLNTSDGLVRETSKFIIARFSAYGACRALYRMARYSYSRWLDLKRWKAVP